MITIIMNVFAILSIIGVVSASKDLYRYLHGQAVNRKARVRMLNLFNPARTYLSGPVYWLAIVINGIIIACFLTLASLPIGILATVGTIFTHVVSYRVKDHLIVVEEFTPAVAEMTDKAERFNALFRRVK